MYSMSFEGKKDTGYKNESDNIKKFLPYVKILRRELLSQLPDQFHKRFSSDERRTILLKSLKELLREKILFRFKELEPELEMFLLDLDSTQPEGATEQELQDWLVDRAFKFISSRLKIEDFEASEKTRFLSSLAYPDSLNEILAYDVIQYSGRIELHIPPTITDSPLKLRTLFIDGLKKLAKKVKEKESMRDIREIGGTSWIIKDYKKLVESLGFIIENESQYWATAAMSREDLLRLYG